MKLLSSFLAICLVVLAVTHFSLGAPAETSSLRNGSDAKSAFGQPFDEIVVESTLNVKRKAGGARQSRTDQAASVRTKRQQKPNFAFPNFQSSVADASAQAQAFDVNNPFGKFGSSASGSQGQSLAFGPNGSPVASATFAGSQQYRLPNGQTLDIAFGKSASNTGTNNADAGTLTINGPSG